MHVESEATQTIQRAAELARDAARVLARSSAAQRNDGLRTMAARLREQTGMILAANAVDLDGYSGSAAFRDRLTLTPARVEGMARGLEEVAELPDPLERVLAEWTRPNGLRIQRIATPIGVIGMIYESRPNVGADAAGLCLKSGNAVILRGGSESLNSARAIHAALADGLCGGRIARSSGAGRADGGSQLRRRDAVGSGADRPDYPARRQVLGGARAAGGACTGARACGRALPHVCACGGRS